MKTPIVYTVIAHDDYQFVEELFCSIYSLRLYEPERKVIVICDQLTADYINSYKNLACKISHIIVADIDSKYNTPKLRSREIKTSIPNFVSGPFLYIDTDTVICGSLNYIDNLSCDVAGVPEGHIEFSKNIFRKNILANIKNLFNYDASSHPHWINGGVIYSSGNENSVRFYKHWHDNWEYTTFNKGISQDMPSLLMAEVKSGILLQELEGYYNSQPFMSVKYFGEAKILHFLHSYFPKDQSFCPFFDKSIYKKLKETGDVTEDIAEILKHPKTSFSSPSIIVGENTVNFMTSPIEPIFEKIYNEGGLASWFMMKVATWLDMLHKFTKKK